MRCRRPVRVSLAQIVEQQLQLGQSGDDDANGKHLKLPQEAKVVQVAVIEFGFVIPLHLDPDAVLEIVDLVRWGRDALSSDKELRLEALFFPTATLKKPVDRDGYRRATSSPLKNVGPLEPKCLETSKDVPEFTPEVSGKNRNRMFALVELKLCT